MIQLNLQPLAALLEPALVNFFFSGSSPYSVCVWYVILGNFVHCCTTLKLPHDWKWLLVINTTQRTSTLVFSLICWFCWKQQFPTHADLLSAEQFWESETDTQILTNRLKAECIILSFNKIKLKVQTYLNILHFVRWSLKFDGFKSKQFY